MTAVGLALYGREMVLRLRFLIMCLYADISLLCCSMNIPLTPMVCLRIGCRVFWKDRKLNKGRIAIYMKEYFPELSLKLKNNALYLLVLELAPKYSKHSYLSCWYRLPTSGIDIQALQKTKIELEILDQDEKKIILVGNLNCDFKYNQNINARMLVYILL